MSLEEVYPTKKIGVDNLPITGGKQEKDVHVL
jgi:hypothetical protein